MREEEVIIRAALEEDAQELLEIYAPYVLGTAITFEYEVPSLQEFAGRIRHTLKKFPYLVAVRDGSILGYAYVSPFKARPAYDWAVETSIYIRTDMRRRGIGKRLYEKLEDILKVQNILNMNACIGYPAEEDAHLTKDSVIFHEHLGYRMVGEFRQCGYKFHTWYNMVWMEKHIGEHQKEQALVRNFDEIREQFDL